MNLSTLTRRLRQTERPRRCASLAVAALDQRLVLSPALPLPPPVAASMVANYPIGPAIPNGPPASQVASNIPSGPCIPVGPPASRVASNLSNGPCIPVGPPASQDASNFPTGPCLASGPAHAQWSLRES
jgi:hypothetical protein